MKNRAVKAVNVNNKAVKKKDGKGYMVVAQAPDTPTSPVGVHTNVAGQKLDDTLAFQVVTHYALTGNAVKTGKEFGIHHNTVIAYVSRNPELYGQARDIVKVKALVGLDTFIQEALSEVLSDPDRMKATSLRDLLVSIGIAIDKSAKLAGEATLTLQVDASPRVISAAKQLLAVISQLPKEALRDIETADFELIEGDDPSLTPEGLEGTSEPQASSPSPTPSPNPELKPQAPTPSPEAPKPKPQAPKPSSP